MRHPYVPALLLALGLPLTTRAQQPFEQFGVKVEILTLTHGRFPEFFDNDSLRRIGSVMYDTRLQRVAYLLPPDSLVGRAESEVTARWLSVDPLAETDAHITPYAYCGNNAVRYNDPDGRQFTDAAQQRVDAFGNEINSRLERNNNRIAEIRGKMEGGGLSDKQLARLGRQVDRLNSSNSDLQAVQGEIATLASSTQVYDIQTSDKLSDTGSIPGLGTSRGGAGFNFSTGIFEITLPNGGGFSTMAHELKHAYQFETGEYSVGPQLSGVTYSNLLYDKHDEVAGYARGAMFGGTTYGINTLPIEYSNVATGPYNTTNVPIIGATLGARNRQQLLQNAANRTGHAFRVGGQTYYKNR